MFPYSQYGYIIYYHTPIQIDCDMMSVILQAPRVRKVSGSSLGPSFFCLVRVVLEVGAPSGTWYIIGKYLDPPVYLYQGPCGLDGISGVLTISWGVLVVIEAIRA